MARKGLPAKYIRAAWKTKGATKKNALKRAWAAYRKSSSTSKSRSSGSKTKTSKKTTRRKRNLTGKRKRGSRKFTIPLAPIAGIIAAPAVRAGVEAVLAGNWKGAMDEAGKFVGWGPDGKFDAFALGSNIGPIILGIIVHKFVGGPPLNVNRMLAAANVPVIRI